jgi:hypothetical protein
MKYALPWTAGGLATATIFQLLNLPGYIPIGIAIVLLAIALLRLHSRPGVRREVTVELLKRVAQEALFRAIREKHPEMERPLERTTVDIYGGLVPKEDKTYVFRMNACNQPLQFEAQAEVRGSGPFHISIHIVMIWRHDQPGTSPSTPHSWWSGTIHIHELEMS